MMGFRDMTFCTAECGNKGCFRQITEEVKDAGKQWWGSENFPIMTANFKDMCENWKEKEDE